MDRIDHNRTNHRVRSKRTARNAGADVLVRMNDIGKGTHVIKRLDKLAGTRPLTGLRDDEM